MEILGIIPVRGGSKGIKRKNIKEICNKPLVAYTIEAAQKSKYITRVVVSTEDAEIKKVCEGYGVEVIDRPQELAQDETKTAPVMLQVADTLEAQGYRPHHIVLLQATCPLRDAKYIDDAYEYFFENVKNGYDSCFSAFGVQNTHACWRQNHDGSLLGLYDYRLRPRRQESHLHYPMICENGAFYSVRYDVFKKVKDFIGENPIAFVTQRVIDIDEEEDFLKVAKLLEQQSGAN